MMGLEGRTGRIGYAAATVAVWLSGVVGAPVSRALLGAVETAPDQAAVRLYLDLGNLFGLVWTLGFTALFFVFTIRRARDIGLPPLMTFIAWKVLTIAEAATAAGWSPEVSTPVGDWRLSSLGFQVLFTLVMIALPSKGRPADPDAFEIEPEFQPAEPPSRPLPPVSAPMSPSTSRATFGLRQ